VGKNEFIEDEDEARVLVESFFPKTAELAQEMSTTPIEEIRWKLPITHGID
jgi:hypothetical protein